jgi:tripartite-type tricarboxylate transporter receptor subunit TctC
VRYTSAGVGSFPHFDMEVFSRRAGIEMVHIPNKTGAAGMINDLVVGDAQTSFLNAASSAAMIKAGKMRPIAVLAERRLADYPDVPTLAEVGYPGVGTLHWQSMLAPAHTPKEVLATIYKAIVEAAAAPQLQEGFKKQLVTVKPSASLDEAQSWLNNELAAWRKTVAEVKIELTD